MLRGLEAYETDPDTTEGTMKAKVRAARRTSSPRRLSTTLGEVISAAYEAVPGFGTQRLERALRLLTRSPLARQMSPHVEFVR